ncbi:hypothetical protein Daura_31995 [Dactylosporangium aurantiacum]|uniref:Uncharacterized protein n=1 Tax=Dactylosporangium aurantiacum TaxID=35754 RepID=A0A9Q9I8Z1_9ACTN|nr:hypothetical protein [Dactylosporangium aurantiacum]MDG6107061.1 hypothetical protein [Dactylosporangium aurantiacum]UWZ51361.1 hypothetical protein Daura_31995 [Dactylosporangium aurantiacum]
MLDREPAFRPPRLRAGAPPQAYTPPALDNQTPWQELFRAHTGQMDSGSCLDFAVAYQDVAHTKGLPRDSH